MVSIQQAMNSPLGHRERGSARGFRRGPGKHNRFSILNFSIFNSGDTLDNLPNL